jgi:hypothetical protein
MTHVAYSRFPSNLVNIELLGPYLKSLPSGYGDNWIKELLPVLRLLPFIVTVMFLTQVATKQIIVVYL